MGEGPDSPCPAFDLTIALGCRCEGGGFSLTSRRSIARVNLALLASFGGPSPTSVPGSRRAAAVLDRMDLAVVELTSSVASITDNPIACALWTAFFGRPRLLLTGSAGTVSSTTSTSSNAVLSVGDFLRPLVSKRAMSGDADPLSRVNENEMFGGPIEAVLISSTPEMSPSAAEVLGEAGSMLRGSLFLGFLPRLRATAALLGLACAASKGWSDESCGAAGTARAGREVNEGIGRCEPFRSLIGDRSCPIERLGEEPREVLMGDRERGGGRRGLLALRSSVGSAIVPDFGSVLLNKSTSCNTCMAHFHFLVGQSHVTIPLRSVCRLLE